jgi:hypothetical protein
VQEAYNDSGIATIERQKSQDQAYVTDDEDLLDKKDSSASHKKQDSTRESLVTLYNPGNDQNRKEISLEKSKNRKV